MCDLRSPRNCCPSFGNASVQAVCIACVVTTRACIFSSPSPRTEPESGRACGYAAETEPQRMRSAATCGVRARVRRCGCGWDVDMSSNVGIEPPSERAKPACEGRSRMVCWAAELSLLFLEMVAFHFLIKFKHLFPRFVIHLCPLRKLEALLRLLLLKYEAERKPMNTWLIHPLPYPRVVCLGKETQHDSSWAGRL